MYEETVEKGSSYYVRSPFSPNITEASNFTDLSFGYYQTSTDRIPLTVWISNEKRIALKSSSVFAGRTKILNKTVLRTEDARFSDEGFTFYVACSYFVHGKQNPKVDERTGKVTLVYGKGACRILQSYLNHWFRCHRISFTKK